MADHPCWDRAVHPPVNPGLSWQSLLTNNVLLRTWGKNRVRRYKSVGALRQYSRKVDQWLGQPLSDVAVTSYCLNQVEGHWLSPWGGPQTAFPAVLLYLHGGGFCLHFPRLYRHFVAELCRPLAVPAFLANYRLAPEHPFPAAVEDGLKAYLGLLNLGYRGEQIVIAGDSAGGCLTLTTLLQIRDKGLPHPAGAVMLSPGTDLGSGLESLKPELEAGDPVLSAEFIEIMMRAYVPEDADLTTPLLSPARGDFTGLPELAFHVGSKEIIFDHSLKAVERARACGVDAQFHVWRQMPHVHPLFTWLPESQQALNMIRGFFRRKLALAS